MAISTSDLRGAVRAEYDPYMDRARFTYMNAPVPGYLAGQAHQMAVRGVPESAIERFIAESMQAERQVREMRGMQNSQPPVSAPTTKLTTNHTKELLCLL